jgi:hypothetical protein
MSRISDWCDEATFTDWEQASGELPDWQLSLLRHEQLVRPLDGRPERPLARLRVPPTTQQVEAGAQTSQELGRNSPFFCGPGRGADPWNR